MKKLITILMALTLVGGILAGCQGGDAAKTDTTKPADTAKTPDAPAK